ncbi:MAG: hypothetical protein FWC65_05360 [Treponema sp.]|nr:hypothetical protein [Treponema sp.]
MKNFAKLTLFFTLNFTLLFFAAVVFGLLSAWIEFARVIPIEARPGADIIRLTWNAFPAALYFSILLTLSYTARRNMPIPAAIIGVFVLAAAVSLGIPHGINSLEASRGGTLEAAFRPVHALQAGPGLILSRSENAWVLLRESRDIRGPRVVSIPGQPLIYQETPLGPGNTILTLPPLPFYDSTPWFVRNLTIDFSLSAAEMRGRRADSFFSFAIYAAALILLLVSLRFVFGLSRWPLANLFMGILAFRGIAALEALLGAQEVTAALYSFAAGRLAAGHIAPAIFAALAVLFIFYTLLIRMAQAKRSEDE